MGFTIFFRHFRRTAVLPAENPQGWTVTSITALYRHQSYDGLGFPDSSGQTLISRG
jgi:hypothetical protein